MKNTYKLVFALILGIFLAACAEEGNLGLNNVELLFGRAGHPCKKDGSCEEGLVCNERNVCVGKSINWDEVLCRSDGDCQGGLVCNEGFCAENEKKDENEDEAKKDEDEVEQGEIFCGIGLNNEDTVHELKVSIGRITDGPGRTYQLSYGGENAIGRVIKRIDTYHHSIEDSKISALYGAKITQIGGPPASNLSITITAKKAAACESTRLGYLEVADGIIQTGAGHIEIKKNESSAPFSINDSFILTAHCDDISKYTGMGFCANKKCPDDMIFIKDNKHTYCIVDGHPN
jgi:hypothetical protein